MTINNADSEHAIIKYQIQIYLCCVTLSPKAAPDHSSYQCFEFFQYRFQELELETESYNIL